MLVGFYRPKKRTPAILADQIMDLGGGVVVCNGK